MKKNNKKGFTLAELLIVVAIIAVLVAIAIPVFTNQLEKSRDAVSVSNMRAAYAEAATAMLTSNGKAVSKTGNITVAAASGGTQVVTVENVVIKSQEANDWSGLAVELPWNGGTKNDPTDPGASATPKTMTFTFTLSTGAVVAAFAS